MAKQERRCYERASILWNLILKFCGKALKQLLIFSNMEERCFLIRIEEEFL